MKVLVLGSGGREHAICWSIAKSSLCKKIYCIPGNPGISQNAECVNIKINDFRSIKNFINKEKINFVIVGPEEPLVNGMVDKIKKLGVKAFGPSKKASKLESSKVFSKEFCKRNNIPTANYKKFSSFNNAKEYINKINFPVVIKASGLAAGKGVFICKNKKESINSLKKIMIFKKFKNSGKQVVIEDFLVGEEISSLAIVSGKNYIPLLLSQDHKKVYENDKGPNTGGMGAYCPLPFLKDNIQKKINKEIIEPTINAMVKEGRSFNGILYSGLMKVKKKLFLIEYNVRFGDPECQPLLFLLKSDLLKTLIACTTNNLGKIKVKWRKGFAFTVVVINKGYPNKFKKNKIIKNLNLFTKNTESMVFHSGTSLDKNNNIIAKGGRVLSVTSYGKDFNKAKSKTYKIVKKIKWENSSFRKDIGYRAKKII